MVSWNLGTWAVSQLPKVIAMKLRITLCLFIALVPASVLAQELTSTATSANTVSSKTLIDLPGLTGNPMAIIVATPVGNTAQLNTHPVGAWYYSGKWNIFNSDHAVMPLGAKYKVRFFKEPGPNHFMHLVTQQNLGAEGSYIDNPALNNNPSAQVAIFQNYAPDVRTPYYLNRFEAKASYSSAAERWYIANVNGEPIYRGTVYNIVVTPAATVGANTNPGATPPGPNPTSVPPNQNPAGDLSGNRPPPAPVQNPTPVQNPPPVAGINPLPIEPPSEPKQPFRDWTLHEEAKPAIPPNAEIILFIHGMDSRAEEAADITKELFALKTNPPAPQSGPPAPPTNSQTPTQQMSAVLQQLLQKYKGCILEKYETQQDLINRGLSGNLSGLINTNGLQVRDANVVCLAGNICSLASRAASFNSLQVQANSGNATNFEANLKKAIPKDCFQCSKHQEMHTKHVHCTMEAGGNSGPFQGPAFEGCKAGVDMEALANSIINDIHKIFINITGNVPDNQVTGGASVATNISTVQFTDCTSGVEGCPESCDYPDQFPAGVRTAFLPQDGADLLYFAPIIPKQLLDTELDPGKQINIPAAHNIGKNEGRLRSDLRDAAAHGSPFASLRLAAFKFAAGDPVTGKAFADLSVTGHRAFKDFSLSPPKESFCQSVAGQRPSQLTEAAVLDGCRKALDRAYRVANFLRAGQRGDTPAEKARKRTERKELGWIAVSGEDDSPHRPVNVPSSDYPQHDIDVVVATLAEPSLTVRTRYVIAQSQTTGADGKYLVVISLDLPTSGYTENLNYDRISPLELIGTPKWTPLPVPIVIPPEILYVIPGAPVLPPGIVPGIVIPPGTPLPDFEATGQTPLLDFIENFIVRFAETLDLPSNNNIKAVMGGSLGGNMTFRLGRRQNVTWLPRFIVWSPASIWNSLGEGSDILKHIAPRRAWEGANQTHKSPGPGDRAAFFGSWDEVILPVLIPMAQSDTWTSDFYPCKKSTVAAARLDRHETYDANFLAWHWRLGAEQLLYSHQTIDPATSRPRFMANQKPMLLACGTEDHVKFNDICPATRRTAPLMTLTPGKTLILDKTGHSLDNERRNFWAKQIMEFLGLK